VITKLNSGAGWKGQESRGVYLSTTIIQGRLVARIAILNLRTTAQIIEEVVNAIRTFVSQVAAREPESKVNHD